MTYVRCLYNNVAGEQCLRSLGHDSNPNKVLHVFATLEEENVINLQNRIVELELEVEVGNLRTATRKNKLEVQEIIIQACRDVFGKHDNDSIQNADWAELFREIAASVTEQIAGKPSAPRLTPHEVDVCWRMRKGLLYDGEFTELLDKLIAASKEGA